MDPQKGIKRRTCQGSRHNRRRRPCCSLFQRQPGGSYHRRNIHKAQMKGDLKMMTGEKRYSNTAYLALCGLFAALTAVCTYISIPLGFTPVPVNLATLAVFLAGGILGMKYGTVSLMVYVLLGAVGLPVFSNFSGGPGVLMGPTGGYIAGYIAAAFIVGFHMRQSLRRLFIGTEKNRCLRSGHDMRSDRLLLSRHSVVYVQHRNGTHCLSRSLCNSFSYWRRPQNHRRFPSCGKAETSSFLIFHKIISLNMCYIRLFCDRI